MTKKFAVIRIKPTNSVEMSGRERYERFKANNIEMTILFESDNQREVIDFWIDRKY